jgi:hypothetical protein
MSKTIEERLDMLERVFAEIATLPFPNDPLTTAEIKDICKEIGIIE